MQLDFFGFEDDIINECLKRYSRGGTLFVLPTNKSRREAAKLYQSNWEMPLARFCTMESWKEELFETKNPILKDQKQKLALFSTLTHEDKQALRLTNYASSVDFAKNFFSFWQKLGEELVSPEQVEDVLANSESYQNWQLEHFRLLCDIRKRYQDSLSRHNFADTIFLYNLDNLNLTSIAEFEKVVVVNQFYFTALEKRILAEIKEKLVLCMQIPEACYDKENLRVKNSFSAADLKDIRTEKLHIYRAKDEFSMLNRLLTVLDDTKLDGIVDFKYCEHLYSSYLNEERFSILCSPPFSGTKIYRFIKIVHELCSAIHKYRDSFTGKELIYLPIKDLYKIIGSEAFIHYFTHEKQLISSLQGYINQLVRNEFKYIDLQKRFFAIQKPSEAVAEILSEIFDYLDVIWRTDSIKGLIDTLNFERIYKNVCSEEEKYHTDAADVFFEALMEFESLETIRLIENWEDITSGITRVLTYMEILLAISEEKKVSYCRKKTGGYRFMTLHDTRNLKFDKLAVLNLIEGVIPPTRQTPYLLSETQRRNLGLKTYDDICSRERYYLYRVIAQTKEVHLFGYQNIETDTQQSSYLEALQLHCQKMVPDFRVHPESISNYDSFFNTLLDHSKLSFKPENTEDESFFRFPYLKDDKLNRCRLSPTSILKLLTDPFVYYLDYELNLKPLDITFPNELSPQFLGSFIHQIFAAIWQRIIEVYEGKRVHHNFLFTARQYAGDAIEHVWSKRADLSYKIPHNFGSLYFKEIYLPTIRASMENFFWELHNSLELSDKMIEVFPETEFERKKKMWQLSERIEIELVGQADLRIHTPKNYLIFDLKTGSQNDKKKHELQLLLYMYLYYSSEALQQVISYIYYTKDKKMHKLECNTKELEALKSDLALTLEDIFEQGYGLSEKAQKYEPLELTRRDLLSKRRR